MIESLLEAIKSHGHQTWVGLCVFVMIAGFFLCVGNLRRRVLIGYVILIWGISFSYYEDFYNAPIARYLWFPYWVVLQGSMILFINYLDQTTAYFAIKMRIVPQGLKTEELRQESVVTGVAIVLIVVDIGQLGSALAGYGRATSQYYDDICRLMLSVAVIALVVPGFSGLKALKDAFSEKMVSMGIGRFNSHQYRDRS